MRTTSALLLAGIEARLFALVILLSATTLGHAQEVVDRFNRTNNNTVGGGWSETETGAAGASIDGNALRLQRTGTGNNRQFVTQTTPGTYSTTLSQNNCTLTWAFSFRQSESEGELSGFDGGDDGMAVVLAGSNANLTLGQGYAVVLGESGNTDRVRLVRYNGGLDADGNITTIIQAGNFDNDYLDVRVTYVPSTNTWSLHYRDNGNTRFSDPLTAATSAGSAVDATYTGAALSIIGCLWNHDGDTGESARFDNFHVPGGRPTLPAITPPSASICDGSSVDLTASATSSTTTRVTFSSAGGPSTVSGVGANDGSVYPWSVSVSGLPASGVSVESVTINGITHTYPDDLDLLLQSATGTNVILMSDAGGGTDVAGNNYVFMDGESAMADDAVNNSGIYAPTNSGATDSWPTAPGPGSLTQASPSLSLFTGDFNGGWALLIRDDANLDSGSIASWSITFTYASTVSYAWSPAAGLSGTSGSTVTATPAGTSTYTVTASHSGNGCTHSADVSVTVAGCTYYSRASGNVNDAIWSTTPSGAPAPSAVIFTPSNHMVVQNGHQVTNTAITAAGNITVDAGGELVVGNGTSLQSNGNVTANGVITAQDNSELELTGTAASALSLGATTSFYVLTVNNAAGVTLTGAGTAQIRGTLLLQDGNFDCMGHPVTLRSTATYTGRLGPVAATASYTGNMRIERYIPAGATNWRLIGSPILNRDVVHLHDDFFTAGYPGSQYPNFFDPPGSGIFWPSIRWYDETNTGAGQNDGMTGVSSHLHDLLTGQGFAAWCGTNLTTTTAFSMNLENQAPVIASSPISLPMSFTNTGNASVDGWNLVSNPLPSPIAFDQIVRGADVADYVTYFNPAAGNAATYDISSGISVNGGTNTIQSFQGFFLKATGPDATATVSESAKVNSNNGGFFGGTVQGPGALSLQLSSAINTFSDETLVIFSEGSPEVNSDDVPKYVFAHPQAPQISTMGPAAQLLAINAYGAYSTEISIPIAVDAGVSGEYTLTATGAASMGLSCLRIEDLHDGTITPLNEGTTYSFTVNADDDATLPRLMLHASAPLPINLTDVLCHGQSNGVADIVLGDGPADVTMYNDMGGVMQEFTDASGEVSFTGLAIGDYEVHVQGILGCANLIGHFNIEAPAAIEVSTSATDASCPGGTDGQAVVNITGGTAPYSVLWSNGATGSSINVGPGVYTASITDASGCELNSAGTEVGSGPGPVADASASSGSVMTGQEVAFTNTSVDADSYAWDFGDGATSSEQSPTHAYDLPGQYIVTLTAYAGDCLSSFTLEITVELSTGVAQAQNQPQMRAWLNGDHLVVEHQFGDKYPVHLELLNEAGQVHQQMRVAGPAGRMSVPADDLASGIWYVRVSNDQIRKTLPVVVVR